jgi:hypothetical protein
MSTPRHSTPERAARAAREAACPVQAGEPDRSEYDEWGRHKDYVEQLESDDGLGGSIPDSVVEEESDESSLPTQQEFTDDEDDEDDPDDEYNPDDSIADLGSDKRGDAPAGRPWMGKTANLTAAALKSREFLYAQQQNNIKVPTDDGLAGSIQGSTDEETTAAVAAMSQEEWIKVRDKPIIRVRKPRGVRRICSAGEIKRIIEDKELVWDERVIHADFSQPASFKYVGHDIYNTLVTVADEPSKSMMQEYIKAKLQGDPRQEEVLKKVDGALRTVALDLFDARNREAKKSLLVFLGEECPGNDHDGEEVREIVRYLEPMEMCPVVLIRMLEAIYVQGNQNSRQITTLRSHVSTLREQNEAQEKRLVDQEKQLHELKELVTRQSLPREETDQSPAHKKARQAQHSSTETSLGLTPKEKRKKNATRDAEREAFREAIETALLEHFCMGGPKQHELSSVEVQACLREHNLDFTPVAKP